MKLVRNIFLGLIPALFLAGNGSAAVDPYDSTVIRSLLDAVGWSEVPVDSVFTPFSSDINIAEVQRATTLNLSYREGRPNKITELPDEIGKLPELTSLSLRGNELTALPDAISRLHKLSRLDLSENRLSGIPEEVKALPLQVLYCDRDSIAAIPDWIDTLATLTTLYLDNNTIETIPAAMIRMSDLKISINGNMICTTDTTILRWLDAHHLTPDWSATQQCDPVSSVVTESVTNTVVLISSDIQGIASDCQPISVQQVDTDSFDWFTRQTVLKAVTFQINECFTADRNNFIVTFSWDDIDSMVDDGADLSVYYVVNSTAQYIEAVVDPVKKTITVRTSRTGIYMLTGSASTPTPLRQTHFSKPKSVASVQHIYRNSMLDFTWSLTQPSSVHFKLLALDGRQIKSITRQAGTGEHRLQIDVSPIHNRVILAVVQSGEFREVRRINLF